MRHIIGTLLIVVGFIMGTFGDYPFDALPYQNLTLMAVGGLSIGIGIGVLILGSGGRGGGREDEPPRINP